MRKTKTLQILLLLIFTALPSAAVVENDFSYYPSAAQSCLYSAAENSECNGDTVPEMNNCLCGNKKGGWVTLTADCLGSSGVDSTVIADTYSQMETNCGESGNSLAVTREEFFNHVDAASGTTTMTASSSSEQGTATLMRSSEPTTIVVTISGSVVTLTTSVVRTSDAADSTASSTTQNGADGTSILDSDSQKQDDPEGLSTAKIGIIAGCSSAAVIILIIVVYLIVRKRMFSKNTQAEAHPMPDQSHSISPINVVAGRPGATGSTIFSSTEPSMAPSHAATMYGGSPSLAPGSAYNDEKWRQSVQRNSVGGSPHPGYGAQPQQQWMHPSQVGQHTGSTSPQGGYMVQGDQPQQFAAELPGSHGVQPYELGDQGLQDKQN